jgi:CheY-like chemotaxis protein
LGASDAWGSRELNSERLGRDQEVRIAGSVREEGLTVRDERRVRARLGVVSSPALRAAAEAVAPSIEIDDDRYGIAPGDSVLLIVEDDPHYARLMADLARDKGFKVMVALQGEQALELASAYQPSAVSLDIFLPDMLGWNVLGQLKQNPITRHIPVQIVTLDEDRQHGLARGAFSVGSLADLDSFLTAHPFSVEEEDLQLWQRYQDHWRSLMNEVGGDWPGSDPEYQTVGYGLIRSATETAKTVEQILALSDTLIREQPESALLANFTRRSQCDIEALRQADIVVLAPGDLYTSLGPILSADGYEEALKSTEAKIVYVCNLVTKRGQTDGFTVIDHAAEIERLVGGPILDLVLYNNAIPDQQLLERYAKDGEYGVEFDEQKLRGQHYKAKGDKFLANGVEHTKPGDPLAKHRTFIRHDGDKIARVLMDIKL